MFICEVCGTDDCDNCSEKESICQYCRKEMPFHKAYAATLDFDNKIYSSGHKSCMMAITAAYKKFGKVMTKKEYEGA